MQIIVKTKQIYHFLTWTMTPITYPLCIVIGTYLVRSCSILVLHNKWCSRSFLLYECLCSYSHTHTNTEWLSHTFIAFSSFFRFALSFSLSRMAAIIVERSSWCCWCCYCCMHVWCFRLHVKIENKKYKVYPYISSSYTAHRMEKILRKKEHTHTHTMEKAMNISMKLG